MGISNPYQMQSVTSPDGTAIAYDRTGEGPPLLLVHGSGADHRAWNAVRPLLAERFTVYAMDRRGRGDSGDHEAYSIEREFEDVAAVVDDIGRPVHVVAHSFGALCALGGATRTDNVASLTLYEPPIRDSEDGLLSEDVAAEMTEAFDAGEDERAVSLFFGEFAKLTTSPPKRHSGPESAAAPNVDAIRAVPRESAAADDFAFAPADYALDVPTLLLLGGDSEHFFQAAVERVADGIPDSTVRGLAGCKHLAIRTAPEAFAREVTAFLTDRA